MAEAPGTGEAVTAYAGALADELDAALPGWIERSAAVVVSAWRPEAVGELAPALRRAAEAAAGDVGPRLRRLLGSDIDQQATTPLALVRQAVRYPTEVLRRAGVPPVQRDEFAERAFPDDVYNLSPATWADLGPGVAEAGLAWGAAKAFEHRRRHRS